MKLSALLALKGPTVVTISPTATVRELLLELTRHKIGALVVSTDGSSISGIVSERDLVSAFATYPDAYSLPVSTIMTSEVFVAPPDAHVDELMQIMTDRRFRHVPVTDDDGSLIGIVSIGDIVKSRLGELETEKEALLGYITHGG
jgi:CBS domain-containing protein